MLHTDDLIRDTEKNIARGYSDDFTDLFKYAYEKGKTEAIEECISKLDSLYSIVESRTKYPQYDHYCNGIEDCIDLLENLKEQKNV